MSKSKGSRWERDLVNLLYEMGHGVMRIPASGSASEHELPDVFAGVRGTSYAIEAKYRNDDVVYLDGGEIEHLRTFAEKFGAVSIIATRFSSKPGDPYYGDDDASGWYFLFPEQTHKTNGGNYRVKKETALADGLPLEML